MARGFAMPMCRLAFAKSDSIFVSSRCFASCTSFDQRTSKCDRPLLSRFLCFGCSDSCHLKCHVKCQFKPSPATVSCDQPAFHNSCTALTLCHCFVGYFYLHAACWKSVLATQSLFGSVR